MLPLEPPISPMLAQLVDALPVTADYLFEPKWDGFRTLVFHGGERIYLQSRDGKPLDRYFPDLHEALKALLPKGCIVDGEIVIATPRGLDFDALQLRLHPSASRVAKLAAETPASFVAFDLLAEGGRNLMAMPQAERRATLERVLQHVPAPVHVTPMTRDPALAQTWLREFEGAGLDGVIAKRLDLAYLPGKRAMQKVKHVRTADCVVAGFRWYKDTQDAVGSLLLGLYDDAGTLHHVGMTSAFSMGVRRDLAEFLAPLRANAAAAHPWRDWQDESAHAGRRMPGGQSRWSAGKDLSWVPLRIERVCEVRYDHMQGDRFRHATHFLRWRPDKPPEACRYDQLEVTAPYALRKVFGVSGR